MTDDNEPNTSDEPAYGDDEPLDFDDFMESLGRVERDEDLVDMTGSGMDVEIPDDLAEQTLSDMLSGWRKDVGSKPMPKSLENLGENVSIQENAAKLRAIAGRTAVMGAVQQAIQQLNEDQAEAVGAADPAGASADAQEINGAFEAAKGALTDALGVVQAAYGAAGDVAGKHGA